ncbi:methionine biosynthesis protein MetW [Accumulibacter sp.]|uniref:methionine biosynthesis protein MetW n=1 Tax=Accumulibacter sp. TaxID=2053492 RepID=UPI0025F8FA46|nr:methionine biosynthesis protein MetW [Accumulibacter sp.]MCM8596064.1 methionine biosynthesis protein MetW [Accumulibacter sp.]MCM8627035.1 methionine biosynthesis protein MetW [Accumulibacter sp.]MDS4050213.1 methionine biosynthesis protein MetW [Accumulibacter sp.]
MTENERKIRAEQRERFDFAVIAGWIPPGERVLDLGCGDGRLLRYLSETRDVTGYGVEIDRESVLRCIRNGVDVIQMDIECGLSGFEDHSFDHVIISQALQTMRATERILCEMLRVAGEAVVSFPNFAYLTNRVAIADGHMPVSEDLPYDWFDTPNVRFFTIADFENLCEKLGIEVRERLAFDDHGREVDQDPNLNGSLAFYRLGRKA